MSTTIALPFDQLPNLLTPFLERVEHVPNQRALTVITDSGVSQDLSVGELHAESVLHADALRRLAIEPGDVVVIVLGHSRTLISTFLGALYVGAVPAIFPYLTEKLDPAIYAQRVRELVDAIGARAVIVDPAFEAAMRGLLADVVCDVISTDTLRVTQSAAPELAPRAATRGDVAYLQFTSGTSGLHKAIPQSHDALLRYIVASLAVDRFVAEDVIVSWLPLYHDLGLVTGLLIPLVLGVPTVLMSPFRWVRDPKVLFQAMHAFRGTICWMPNFALNHCVQTIRERDVDGIDMRTWRSVVCGGEQVRHDSQQQFMERFRRFGLREDALQSGYGMAENVCAAASTRRDRPPVVDWIQTRDFERDQRALPADGGANGSLPMVSCGPAFPGSEIRICDGDARPLPERMIGEVVIRSPYLFRGYYRRPDLTARVLRDGWFYSGDLGYLADGELYVCGRQGDRIVVAGRNLYPEQLEALIGTIPGVAAGRVVAFGIPDQRDGTERVVVVCELTPDADAARRADIEREARRRATRELDIVIGEMKLVERGWVIKTSNGKIAHPANREKYLNGCS